jgi:hypothetical protein
LTIQAFNQRTSETGGSARNAIVQRLVTFPLTLADNQVFLAEFLGAYNAASPLGTIVKAYFGMQRIDASSP